MIIRPTPTFGGVETEVSDLVLKHSIQVATGVPVCQHLVHIISLMQGKRIVPSLVGTKAELSINTM